MPTRAIEPPVELLCAALLLTGCLVGGSAAAGRVLPAIPQLLSLPLLLAAAESGSGARGRWWIAALVLGLPALQLVPLPPSLWAGLPGRGPVSAAYDAAGLPLPWLPLSLTPAATERAWLGVVPAVTLFLAVPHLGDAARRRLLHLAVAIGVAGAGLGLMQVAGGPESGLRPYPASSRTDGVGFFANRNHQASFLALLVVLAAALAAEPPGRRAGGAPGASNLRPSGAPRRRGGSGAFGAERAWLAGAGLVLLAGIAASGSRAGFALGAGAGLAAAWILAAGRPGSGRARWLVGGVGAALLVAALALVGTAALRREAEALSGDLRWQIARTTWDALLRVFPAGSGFGSFERLYAGVERSGDLIPAVVNNAHNDWLEVPLEGGLPALLLLAAGLAWLVRATFSRSAGASGRGGAAGSAALAVLWLCALHATVDYALRTMAVNLLLALALGLRTAPAGGSVPARRDAPAPGNARRDAGARPG